MVQNTRLSNKLSEADDLDGEDTPSFDVAGDRRWRILYLSDERLYAIADEPGHPQQVLAQHVLYLRDRSNQVVKPR